MIIIGSNRGQKSYGIKHYIADTTADIDTIDITNEQMGSTVFVIDTSTYYMLNGKKEWKPINTGTSGGGSIDQEAIVNDVLNRLEQGDEVGY